MNAWDEHDLLLRLGVARSKMWGGQAWRARACNGGRGRSPQWGPEAEPLVRVSRGKAPLPLMELQIFKHFDAKQKRQIRLIHFVFCKLVSKALKVTNPLLPPPPVKHRICINRKNIPLAKGGGHFHPNFTAWRCPCVAFFSVFFCVR